MNQIKLNHILLLLLLPILGTAQQELTLHTLNNVWQANRVNPAIMSDNGLTIGLPSVYNRFAISNITLNDILVENGTATSISLDQALPKLEASNQIRNNFSLETLSLGLRIQDNLQLSLHHATRFNVLVDYPKSFAELIWRGNSAFVGETIEFAPDLNIIAYHEFALGAATSIGDFIQIGAKVKLLNGIAHAGTAANNNLSLHTDDDIYQLTLDADFQVNSSALLEYDGFDAINFNLPFDQVGADALFSKNTGIAFDLGGIIQFDKGSVGISLLDIGSINWKTNVSNYSLAGQYEYSGFDVVRDYLEGNTSFESATDTLRTLFEVQETQTAYSTKLPTRLFANASYQILPQTQISAIFYGEWQQQAFRPSIGVNVQQEILKVLSVGATYGLYDGGNAAFGLNANAQLGPVQLFAMTSNIGSIFNTRNASFADFRVGLNLLLQREKEGE